MLEDSPRIGAQHAAPLRPARGFTIIELLVVVTIVGILASVAIPQLLNGLHRARQTRTMTNLRAIGVAVESYQVDTGDAPLIGTSEVNSALLRPLLEPTFAKNLPVQDGWRQPLHWRAASDAYSLSSWGKDLRAEVPVILGPTHSLGADIYYSDGHFSAFPEGTQDDM